MDPDVELVRAAYAAFGRGDIEAAVSTMAPDIDWVEPDEIPDGGPHPGRAAVAAYLSRSRAQWKELTSAPEIVRDGHKIVAEHHLNGVLHDGTADSAILTDVYTVEDGVITKMHAYVGPRVPST